MSLTKIPVLFSDQHLLVINKPAGMPMHPGNGKSSQPTIAGYFKDSVKDSDGQRPGIVHRLDKNTSGVVVIARDPDTKAALQSQFKARKVEKTYLAAVTGVLKNPRARIDVPIGRHPKNPLKRTVKAGGKPAVTEYSVLEQKPAAAFIEVKPVTGRTHQIRVHMSYIGHPVIGDEAYGRSEPELNRLFLHAHKLSFIHPVDSSPRTFTAELPEQLQRFWYNL